MKIRSTLVALVAALALAFAAVASATTLSPPNSRYQGYADTSLVPTPNISVYFQVTSYAPCGSFACTIRDCVNGVCQYSIYIQDGLSQPRAIFDTELGRVFDMHDLSDPERHDLGIAMPGRPSDPALWNTQTNGNGNSTNAAWFADSYSWCARVPTSQMPGNWYSTGDGLTKGDRLVGVCNLIRADYNGKR